MTKNKFEVSPVKEAVFEMDSVVGSIGVHTELLEDISMKFMTVVEELNNSVHNGTQEIVFRECHTEIKMLSQLLNYCTKDVVQDTKDISALRSILFKEVVKVGND